MTDSRIRDDNFYLIGGWMINRLGLKGTALQVFAIVYGFSQDGEGLFSGSLQYLCDFTNASKPTIIKALKELVDAGLLIKGERLENGVRQCTYQVSLEVVKKLYWGGKETLPGVVKNLKRGGKDSLMGGGKETLPNNKTPDNKLDNKGDKGIFQQIADMYNEICISFPRVRNLSEARKKAIKARLKTYSVEDFRTLFKQAEASDFLKGKNRRNWSANFDWLIQDGNMAKVLDGNYDNQGGQSYGDIGTDTAPDSRKGKPQYGIVL